MYNTLGDNEAVNLGCRISKHGRDSEGGFVPVVKPGLVNVALARFISFTLSRACLVLELKQFSATLDHTLILAEP
jgi:hypothetical protein